MRDKWTVLNNTDGILFLPQSGIKFSNKNQVVDLVEYTGKSIYELENDPEIIKNITYNNIVTLDKIIAKRDSSPDKELSDKLDKIIKSLGKKETKQDKTLDINLDEITDKIKSQIEELLREKIAEKVVSDISKEEEKMREDAIQKLIENRKDPEKNLDSFGKKEREVESDDFSDLIDF